MVIVTNVAMTRYLTLWEDVEWTHEPLGGHGGRAAVGLSLTKVKLVIVAMMAY